MARPSRTAFFNAAKSWDAPAVEALLAADPGLALATDRNNFLALHRACAVKPGAAALREAHGRATVAALLDAGTPLEAAVPMDADEGDFRATALWFAVARGENFPLVQDLLARGADAAPCLWAAVWRDDEALLGALLATRPRLNLRAHGETPLFYAARLQRLKPLSLLLDAGADPTIADPKGRDVLAIAQARRLPPSLIARLGG